MALKLQETGSLSGLSLRWRDHGFRERGSDGRAAEITDADRELVREALGADALEGRLVRFVISTGKRVKKDKLKLAPDGWDLRDYRKNPVMLWSHDDAICAPSKPKIGHSVVYPDGDRLRAIAAFLPREGLGRHAEFAWEIGEIAHKFGYAASVGFDVLEDVPASEQEREEWGDRARDSVRQALAEWSPVNIGADPDGLAEARVRGLVTDAIAEVFAEALDLGARDPKLLAAWLAARGERSPLFDLGARAEPTASASPAPSSAKPESASAAPEAEEAREEAEEAEDDEPSGAASRGVIVADMTRVDAALDLGGL
jgi:hypothetical protein